MFLLIAAMFWLTTKRLHNQRVVFVPYLFDFNVWKSIRFGIHKIKLSIRSASKFKIKYHILFVILILRYHLMICKSCIVAFPFRVKLSSVIEGFMKCLLCMSFDSFFLFPSHFIILKQWNLRRNFSFEPLQKMTQCL